QVVEDLRNARVAISPELFVEGERAAQHFLRFVVAALRRQGHAQLAEHLGHLGVARAEASLADRQRPLEQRDGISLPGALSERAEADERRRHLQAVAAVEPFADAERLVEQGPSLVEKAKLGVDAPQGVEKPGLEEGLGPELLAHPLGAAPQELAGIRRRAPGLPRI